MKTPWMQKVALVIVVGGVCFGSMRLGQWRIDRELENERRDLAAKILEVEGRPDIDTTAMRERFAQLQKRKALRETP